MPERTRCVDKFRWFELINYRPHEGQEMFHRSEARFKLLVAGARFGKSLAAAREVEPLILNCDPPTRGWIVGPNYAVGEKEFRYIWNDLVVKMGLPVRRSADNPRAGNMFIHFEWGSEVIVKSADNPPGLLGEELDWLILSEAAKVSETVFERYLFARLGSREGRLIIPTTPSGFDWVYRKFLLGQDPAFPEWESWQFPTSANPYHPEGEIEQARRNLTEEAFAEQYLGEFVHFTGRVYKEFSRAIHVTSDLPASFQRVVAAVDWGYTNPCAMVVVGVDGDGRFYVLDEFYGRRVLVRTQLTEVAKDFRDRYGVECFFCDPSEPAYIAEFNAEGLRACPAKNDVVSGIAKVAEMLKVRGDGRPRVFFSPRCTNTLREMEGYRYPERKSDAPDSEVPLKVEDHAVDALRYAIFSVSQSTIKAEVY